MLFYVPLKRGLNGRSFISVGGGVMLKTGENDGETMAFLAELSYIFFV